MTYGYSSGWCERCGRRRGDDGRCSNCDPWYSSGLVQVGIPVLAATAAALVLIVATFGPRPSLTPSSGGSGSAPRTAVSRPSVLAAPPASWNRAMPSAPEPARAPSFAPTFSQAPTTVAWTSAPEIRSPESRKWEELEQLRSMVWSAAAQEHSTSDSGRWTGAPPDVRFGETN